MTSCSRPRADVLRNVVLLLAMLSLLCLLTFYAGLSRKQGMHVTKAETKEEAETETKTETEAAMATDDNDHRPLSSTGRHGAAAEGGVGVAVGVGGWGEGSRAAKPQFQFINRVVTTFDTAAAAILLQLVARKAPSRDPQLIEVVRHLIDAPPIEGSMTLSKGILDTPQSKEVNAILKQKRKGFFVECGALDGERASNSLPFEVSSGWSGILIEANPYYYTQLLGKNRKVWSLNACLSPFDYATQLRFDSSKGHTGGVVFDDARDADVDPKRKREEDAALDIVPCFPLETILLALNQTHVDYFSLDVEGLELDVLKTIPFDRIDIHVLTVEYVHGSSGKEEYRRFMESKGFKTHKELTYSEPRAGLFAEDYVFVKQSLH